MSSQIISVVRGEADVSELRQVGIQFEFSPDLIVVARVGMPDCRPARSDFAKGVLAYWARGGQESQDWAQILLGASTIIDFGELEEHEVGEQILEAIWGLSAGEEIPWDSIEAIRREADSSVPGT